MIINLKVDTEKSKDIEEAINILVSMENDSDEDYDSNADNEEGFSDDEEPLIEE